MAGITNFFKPTPKSTGEETNKRKKRIIHVSDNEDENDNDDDFVTPPAKKKVKEQIEPSQYFASKKSTAKKPATKATKSEEDKDVIMTESSTSKAAKATTSTKATPTTKSKAKVKHEDDEDFIPQDKTEKVEETPDTKKSSKAGFYAMMHRAPPSALGSRPKPVGSDGCLTDNVFVLSGEFDTITKTDIQDIIKTYGGRVTSAVSGKTTYLLRGRDAGQSKLDKAKKLNTKILDEDGFYNLIESSAGQKKSESTPVQPTTVKETKAKTIKASPTSSPALSETTAPSDRTPLDVGEILWTEKYKPKSTSQIIGNKSVIERLSTWLGNWQENRKKNFPEKDETSGFRSVLLSGPPGVGKTTTAQLLAKEHGYSALELNASDTRNKSVLEEMLSGATDNRSMTEFFSGELGTSATKAKQLNPVQGRVLLIMDEVDGMSGGDRGGSAELARLIRSTKIPVICICNDSRSEKVKPLLKVCYEAKFTRTPAKNMRSKLMSIAFQEKLKIEPNAVDELVSLTGNDIRQIINILSTYRLSKNEMKFGDAKIIGTHNQKYSQISLFDIPIRLLGNSSWQHPNINQLADIYFHDYTLSNLMIFENYPKSAPTKARKWNKDGNPRETECLEMDLLAKAANAIAEGDLVDHRMGSNQEYSLMPVHSIFSCVRPAYYMEGSLAGNRMNFPLWLGQNSKTMKNKRLLANVQNKLRSKATVDLSEVRQNYVPALTCNIFTDITNGQYDKAMDTMDYYYLDRENLETLSDLSLTPKPVMNTLSAAAKRTFNKVYKARSHPVLFELSDTTPLKSKTVAPKEDLEGVIFEVEPEDELEEDE
ncbi:uncharacterized protein BX664DRAFT_329437 [Halteromyces radiatus]|uniref:uncharacterized protein n=1 Tax=Halteromyces radiatus TaxID=101107 RepID=UPI00221FF33A|nr:uncharacterized protein BX664DRAFT_329437 [Halteromyces radiatus]KAI8093321.1 hypothetical protein BX664DRAFT_329437 [Halteromyces radiatus]